LAPAVVPTTANSEATVPSQVAAIPNVAIAGNRGAEKPDVVATAPASQPALVPSNVPAISNTRAAATTLKSSICQPAASSNRAAQTTGVGDSSSSPGIRKYQPLNRNSSANPSMPPISIPAQPP
jgi:hypothetical protein